MRQGASNLLSSGGNFVKISPIPMRLTKFALAKRILWPKAQPGACKFPVRQIYWQIVLGASIPINWYLRMRSLVGCHVGRATTNCRCDSGRKSKTVITECVRTHIRVGVTSHRLHGTGNYGQKRDTRANYSSFTLFRLTEMKAIRRHKTPDIRLP